MSFLKRLFGRSDPEPAPTPEPATGSAFARSFIAALNKHPEVKEVIHDEANRSLKVVLGGTAEVAIQLPNLELEHERLPVGERDGYLAHLVSLVIPRDRPRTLAESRADLVPLVRSGDTMWISSLQSRASRPKPGTPLERLPMVEKPLDGGISLLLGHDSPSTTAVLTQKDIAGWGSLDELLSIARDNLRARSPKPPTQVAARLCVSDYGDCYDASRALLHDWVLSVPLERPLVMAIPSRDRLMIAHESAALLLLEEAQKFWESEPRPISPSLFVPTEEGPQPWRPPESHPAYLRAMKAHLLCEHRAYGEQKELLDAIFGQEGTDVFVATFMATESKDGKVHSYGLWSEGLETFLPRCELVTFSYGDPQAPTQINIPWDDAHKVVGSRMQRVEDLVPPRWHVRSFPDQAELRLLRELERVSAEPRA